MIRRAASRLALLLPLLLAHCASISAVPSPSAAPVLDDRHFTTFDGERFTYRRWLPEPDPKLVVVGFHGIDGAADDYRNIGEHFERHHRGAAVYAPNLRGQGYDPKPSRRGDIRRADDWIRDARTFSRLVAERHPRATLVWCGESMGSLIALHALAPERAAAPRCEALVLASPVTKIPEGLPAWRLFLLRTGAVLFPRARISLEALGGQDAVHVTHDATHQDQVAHNAYHVPDFTFRLLSKLSGLIESAPRQAAGVTVPTLILHAGKDVFSTPDDVASFAAHFPRDTPVTRRLYPDSHHLLFYDRDRESVLADLTAWLRGL
ncbi:MAG: alpha/beta fold hydrolase [Akkermansiaceae bacterium]|nr:alpha/beta fold hydrolase [Akkermansiaceae bacterium]NNM31404.1 alpha/beta fold hydrolase [Akkermansiaceae bacterium]